MKYIFFCVKRTRIPGILVHSCPRRRDGPAGLRQGGDCKCLSGRLRERCHPQHSTLAVVGRQGWRQVSLADFPRDVSWFASVRVDVASFCLILTYRLLLAHVVLEPMPWRGRLVMQMQWLQIFATSMLGSTSSCRVFVTYLVSQRVAAWGTNARCLIMFLAGRYAARSQAAGANFLRCHSRTHTTLSS